MACGSSRDKRYGGFHFPYKISMHQGNEINSDKVNALRVGMYKQQVEEAIGTPLLIDTFDENHWIYVQIDRIKGGKPTEKRFSLFFVNEKLARVVR